MSLRRTAARVVAACMPGGTRYCPLCGRKAWGFLPYGRAQPALMRALDCVGSDLANFWCPHCGAHDRERHLLLYMKATGLLDEMRGKDVLHFAPETKLSQHVAQTSPGRYVLCDLYPQAPNVLKVDMLNMDFDSSSFDVVIANHVLEHVADDRKAIQEILRVLRPGGWAILQTPFCQKLLHTWEDAGISDEATRLLAYGQEDHVRLFGRDVFERFESSGLKADIRTHEQILPGMDPGAVGVNKREPLFLFRKSR